MAASPTPLPIHQFLFTITLGVLRWTAQPRSGSIVEASTPQIGDVDRGQSRRAVPRALPGRRQGRLHDAAAVGLISTQVASATADYATGHMTKGIADVPSREQEISQARRTIANLVGRAPIALP